MHEHHRDRVRMRYRIDGFDSFATHEILEALLFYSIPRGDTNELAHRLMERFGSLRNLIEASLDELLTVDGIGENSAFLLKLVPELAKRYAEDVLTPLPSYRTLSAVSEYLCRKFIGCGNECVYMMLLNNKLGLIDCCKISEGSVNTSVLPIRVITEKVLHRKASMVVLAHNHPNGLAIPSGKDIEVTTQVDRSLATLGVTLLEHLIVADDCVWPILREQMGTVRALPSEVLCADPVFLENFYDIDPETWRASVFQGLLSQPTDGK